VLAHRQLGTPIVWVWDNLNVHLTADLSAFVEVNSSWLTVVQFPAYAPELNPVEGVWSLLKRSLTEFPAANLDHLVRVVKRKLKKIQYRPLLLDGCLTETGLILQTP
jgi:transposase